MPLGGTNVVRGNVNQKHVADTKGRQEAGLDCFSLTNKLDRI